MPDSTSISTAQADTMLQATVYPAVAVTPPAPSSYELPDNFAEADYGGICTSLIDSIGADTVSGRIPHFIPLEKANEIRQQMRLDSIEAAAIVPADASGANEGLSPAPLPQSAGESSALIAVMMGMLVILGFNGSGIWRAFRSYRHDLWNIRRPNVFDDEHTVSLPIGVLLAVNAIVFGGLLLYNIPGVPVYRGFAPAALSIGVMAIYYLFRLTAYEAVGYTFSTPDGRERWLDGFFATEAFTGIFFIIPTILLLLHPQWHDILIIISLSAFILARIIFIRKGVRIFYVNLRSLLYFILYLCTLEIVPLLALYGVCAYLQGYVTQPGI